MTLENKGKPKKPHRKHLCYIYFALGETALNNRRSLESLVRTSMLVTGLNDSNIRFIV